MIAALSPAESWVLMGGILIFTTVVGLAIAGPRKVNVPESPSLPPVRPQGRSVNRQAIDLPLPPREPISPRDPRVIDITDRIGRGRL